MMNKTLTAAIVVVASAGAGFMLVPRISYSEQQPVMVTEVRLTDLHASVNTNGRIKADRVFELRAPAAGACRRIQAHEGTAMKRRRPILEIDGESVRAELAAAAAELTAAEVDSRNVRRGPATEELNQAEADVTRFRVEVENARQTLKTNEWLLARATVLTLVLFLIGTISLIISGIGIMNIMLVTVTERTREIGIKMAIGARRREILFQFPAESLLMATTGGALGILLGVTGPLITMWAAGIDIPISRISTVLAFTLSFVVGVVFGLIPANRAAGLNPSEALRYE